MKYKILYGGILLQIFALICIYLCNKNLNSHDNISNILRQFILACQIYPNDSDLIWPTDLETIYNNIPEFRDYVVDNPIIIDADRILYVRPYPSATSLQPVLITNPSYFKVRGSLICYADGHVGFQKGVSHWNAAKKLINYSKAKPKYLGIEYTDWENEIKNAENEKPNKSIHRTAE